MNGKTIAIGLGILAVAAFLAHVLIAGVVVVIVVVAAGAFARWAFWPHHRLPKHRARHLRWRLRLRLHPGRGHATTGELWLRWGRFASFRESGRTRPSLSPWQRLRHPEQHSFYIGRAHHHHALRVPVQEHGCVIGPPRSYKSALLARIVMDAPGPVVVTSSKPDLFTMTSGLRALRGPVHVFNPQGLGGIPSSVRWSPLDGCTVPSTAIRRADAFALAVSTGGAEDASFWAGKASDGMRGIFAAAAMTGRDMRTVGRWAGSEEVADAVAILAGAGHGDWAAQLAELTGPAEKTAATVRMVMSRAVAFLNDPALAAATLPAPGAEFDIDRFLLTGGTLYLLARGNGEDSTLAPLFAALATEVQHRAVQLASRMPGARLDPPLTMALDEITQICPVPLPAWLADSGGQGISVWTGFHGVSQLRGRWKDHGAQAVLDTTNVRIFLPGLADTDTLTMASKLCGQAHYSEHGSDQPGRHDVMSPDMIRQLPPGFGLIVRNGNAPVVARIARGWEHRPYRRLLRHGLHIASITAPKGFTPPAAQPVAAPADERLTLKPAPALQPAAMTNGNGHKNGAHPWGQK